MEFLGLMIKKNVKVNSLTHITTTMQDNRGKKNSLSLAVKFKR